MSVLKEMADAKHPYYCSESNHYSNEASMRFDTMSGFLDEFEGCDVDMNLCFRWDVREALDINDNPTGRFGAEVFIIHQRKGIFRPCIIKSINEIEAERFKVYLEKHLEVLMEMWKPIK